MRRRNRHGWWLGAAVAVGLLAAGTALSIAGWRARGIPVPPEPPKSADRGAAARRRFPPSPPPLPFSLPVSVSIPAIGVSAPIEPLGESADGTVEVPALSTPFITSWFDEGPAPGQRGPAALFGHVDTAFVGPAVFYRLGDLRPGDTVSVTRADHRVVVFSVDRVAMFPKDAFPSQAVYGPTAGPELRLITCGGPFDGFAGTYLDNVVVFARLIAIRRS
jgi:hypothetical protein